MAQKVRKNSSERRLSRFRRKIRLKKKLALNDRPRLCVFRSNKQTYAQLVDVGGKTLCSVATGNLSVEGKKVDAARSLGKAIGEKISLMGIKSVVFDRNGYLFHGRVKAVADGARDSGLEF